MRRHLPHKLMLIGGAVVAASGASAGAAGTPVTVKTARNAELQRTILVNRAGRTLYSLSAERNGRFICTDRECLSFWTPLTVKRGSRPKGTVRSLGTVRRPDGKTQVTYRARPLYTFYTDRRAGDVDGEGFEDVGVWHAAVVR
jgi:predicted lipoprotein with Yx(FWY)xxD motif